MDKRVIACNYTAATNVAPEGALAYLSYGSLSGGDRIHLLVRSHSGRWVHKWESIKRVSNFRFKTLPPEHPRYNDERVMDYGEGTLAHVKEVAAHYS